MNFLLWKCLATYLKATTQSWVNRAYLSINVTDKIRSSYTVTIKQTETVHTCKRHMCSFKIRELVPSTSRGEMTVRENAVLCCGYAGRRTAERENSRGLQVFYAWKRLGNRAENTCWITWSFTEMRINIFIMHAAGGGDSLISGFPVEILSPVTSHPL